MSNLFTLPKQVIFTNSGALIPGAKVYFFEAGTATPLSVYTDYTLGTAHTHPVVADGNGRLPAIYYASDNYKVTIADAAGVEIYSQDYAATIQTVTQSQIAAALWPQTTAEAAVPVVPTQKQYLGEPIYDLRRAGIVPNSAPDRTANTAILKSLLDPTLNGPVGWFLFTNTTGSDTYYFDDIIQIREGCHLDLCHCTIDFAKSYVAADDTMGFFTFIRDNTIQNGSINVAYDGSAGINAGMVLRIGSRNGYKFSTYTGGIDDEDLTNPMGNITLRNLRLTSNNTGPSVMVLLLGGLENVLTENLVLDGQSAVVGGIYYEFGFYHHEATNANKTSSHAINLHFKNTTVMDLDSTDTTGIGIEMRGAMTAIVDGLYVDDAGGALQCSTGEAMYYNMGAPYANQKPHITARNIHGHNLTGIGIGILGSTDPSGGYLAAEGLTEIQQVDLLSGTLDSFSINDAAVGLVLDAPCVVTNGHITNSTAEGIRIQDECVDFSIDRVDVLDGAAGGIRGDFGGNKFATERLKVGSITNCFIAGNATNAMQFDDTQSVYIGYNRIGYTTTHDGVAETTQDIAVLSQITGSGIICEGNDVAVSGAAVAYSNTSNSRDCMIKNPRGTATTAGTWGADGVHGSESTASLTDVSHAVNTVSKHTGKLVHNSSISKVVRASGPAAADTWVSLDGVTTHSPV